MEFNPQFSKEDLKKELIKSIKQDIQSRHDLIEMRDEEVREEAERNLEQRIQAIEQGGLLPPGQMTFRDKNAMISSVYESIRGLGILGEIIQDKNITEVMINGYEDIFVEISGKLTRYNSTFESKEQLTNIITRFVSDAGRAVNESDPIVDTRLKDGSRVNVVMPPIALNGPVVTIRRFPEEGMTVEKLIRFGSITEEVAAFLKTLVEARYNIFVSGGTGSGKTTFLNALSNFIPRDERIITIEDSAELQIKNIENMVRLETKNAGPDGTGGISIRDLIKSALRMRPERIVVGEVRGAEALDMLQAMNTGHDGSLSTGHANSTTDMLSRLETMVLQGAAGLPLEAIRKQIASGVDIIIHLSRMRDKSRKTVEIVEITGYDNATKEICTNPLFVFEENEHSRKDKVVGSLVRTRNKMVNIQKLLHAGLYDESRF